MKRDCTSELNEGELWFGNVDVSERGVILPEQLSPLKTARLGEQAYDINGNAIPINECRPLIIHKSEAELYDNIMMTELRALIAEMKK